MAALADGVALNIVVLPFAYIFKFGVFQAPLPEDAAVNPLNPFSIYTAMGVGKAILSIVIGLAGYFALNGYLLKAHGQTIGKRLLGIKIVRKNGAPAEFYRLALHRYLFLWVFYMIPIVNMIFGLLDPLLIFRRSRHCLHDDIADTVVVRDIG